MTGVPAGRVTQDDEDLDPDWRYLRGHGLNLTTLELHFPLGADWHTLRECAHPRCDRPASSWPWLCHRCRQAWLDAKAPADVAAWSLHQSAPPERRTYVESPCRVGCARPAEANGLCKSCASARVTAKLTVEQYLATNPTPRPTFGRCVVRVCHRLASQKDTLLCQSHQRQWSAAGRPPRRAWALAAPAVYTNIDVVPLADLPERLRRQVLIGYTAQLRAGGRLSPGQVKSAVRWLVDHRADDFMAVPLPDKGPTTSYLRLWRHVLDAHGADPAAEHARTVIRLNVLNPRYRGGRVDLSDVHAPWLTHLTQQYVLSLAASGASAARLQTAGYAARWFALFLRRECPNDGRQPGDVGRTGMLAYLRWLRRRALDTAEYQGLEPNDPRRGVIAERLLPSLATDESLLVTPQRHYELVRALRDALELGRAWLAANGAPDVHLLEQDVPPYPTRDDTDSEIEGRSQDALPESVFLQLMDEASLALLPAGSPRNAVELALRVGRRPWEIRHVRFDCLEWSEVDVEQPDGSTERRTYPFLVYWMQKVRRLHRLPLHATDAEVIKRQQAHLRAERPDWFDSDGRPLSDKTLLFPTPRRTRANRHGSVPYDSSTMHYWIEVWMLRVGSLRDDHGREIDKARVFPYAFRHTYAQLRADAGAPLDVLQALMAHQDPSTTQIYYRVSHPRRVEAVQQIAAKYRFDASGGRLRPLTPDEDLTARARAGVGSVPVPAGQCHEMNNVRADGRGCPVFYRCFSCTFFTTDFSQLPDLHQLRGSKAGQLARLQAAYGQLLTPGPLADANLKLLREEITQIDELIAKCETDLGSLTSEERATVEAWLHSRDRFVTVIPVEAVTARSQRLDRPSIDPVLIGEAG
jgi:integrase